MNRSNIDTWSRWQSAWIPWLFAWTLWWVLVVVTSLALWQLHSAALQSQGREMRLLSLALTDELDRGLRGAEEGLQALGLELGQRRLPSSGGDTVQALQTRVALMPLVTTLWLLGNGRGLIAGSETTLPPDLQSFLPPLASMAVGATALSKPFTRDGDSTPQVALAFRVGAAGAHPGGWIIAAMPANNLLGAFGVALPASDARMAIFRGDGVRLAEVNVGGLSADEASMVDQHRVGTRRFSDGSDNLVAAHRVSRYGLDVVLSRELGAVLEGWRGALKLAVGALALLLVTMLVAVYIVTRSERQRLAAQHALQVQLARSSRLEALGALAGGVSHDFNNVLAGIVGYGEMAQDAAVPGSDQDRHLGRVLRAAERGKALIDRILSFSRGGARASTVFELEPIVEEVLTLLTASLRPGVVLERVLGTPGARLRGDATQIFEAVMNLCTNAMQAMPDGGMLSVQLERQQVSTPRVLSHSPLAPGHYLALSVADEGVGITPDVMEHLFEPFFSARSQQGGTGLGLAVVFGVVTEFGGAIDVDSQPGHGARFTLYLPECTDALPDSAAVLTAVPEGAGQRLLVVDDEPALLALTQELLTGLGYEAVCFADVRDALHAATASPGRFAAVVTDELMPGLSGTELATALRAQAQHMPVVLVSGYGGALLARRASDAGVSRVLMKPLQRGELARTLAELLH
ncbi:ATP-binding protein [Hydrogenophaga sp.]|uniref:ATP-binding protein n=1 Tax=Hydrogenophaga sp. TaxID=1904254 RepID=UPI00271C623F|nr:ATP-binding protein [Hydrogenophaga sp.]MDO9438862.1 ATP-binding protein [Hydrogenophaga sp.]